jgi:hypothetical protein
MTTTTAAVPRYETAGRFLEAFSARDLDRLVATLMPDVRMLANLPRGAVEYSGPDEVRAAFHRWFVDVDRFELLDAGIGEVGTRLHLRWRARVQAERLGEGWFEVEQQVYADVDASRRFNQLRLLCSGYCHP